VELTIYFTSDECSSSQWKCENGKCIDKSYRCDHADDCGDDSDERMCPLTTGILVG